MATFAASDLTLLPNLVSLARLPLAAAFPFVVDRPPLAAGVLLVAGLSDVLDGSLARRSGRATVAGAIVDPVADKVFALSVVITLLVHGALPLWGLFALTAREIFEAPLVIHALSSRDRRAARVATARANAFGKLATGVQFGATMRAMAWPRGLPALLVAAALTGAAGGVGYWARELAPPRPK